VRVGQLIVVWPEVETWIIGKGSTKRGEKKGMWCGYGKTYGSCWVLWPLFVLGCISDVLLSGACVRDCSGLGVYSLYSSLDVGGKFVGGRHSVVTCCGRIGGGGEDRGENG
jgi:hypothetical protein